MYAIRSYYAVHLANSSLESVVLGTGIALDKLNVLRKIERAER